MDHEALDGDWLRATARLLAMTGGLTGDTTLLAVALVANLAALAAAVAELRQAQQRAAQATAARSAAQHLHDSVARARSRVPRPGQAHVPRHAGPPASAPPVQADIPVTVVQGVPLLPDLGGSPSPQRTRSLPPRRAGPGR